MKRSDLLLWMDLEMTGLNPQNCVILEAGAVLTDSQLKLVAEGPMLCIHHSKKKLRSMEPWSQHHHNHTGLTEACRTSKISTKKAEALLLDFVQTHCLKKTAVLCGNSIWQDRRFLSRYMPNLEAFLHYRMIDVSSVKELVARWYSAANSPKIKKGNAHRVHDDIFDSIDELKRYRSAIFKPNR